MTQHTDAIAARPSSDRGWLRHLQKQLDDDLRSEGIAVPRLREERPVLVRYYGPDTRVFRVSIWTSEGVPAPGLRRDMKLRRRTMEFTCTRDELNDPAVRAWVLELYRAREHGGPAPGDPPVPVTTHWQVYRPENCYFLWTLAALDAYRSVHPDALSGYDPRTRA